MRIEEIIAEHYRPGFALIDRMPDDGGIRSYARLPHGYRIVREDCAEPPDASVVVRLLREGHGETEAQELESRAANVHVVFADAVDSIFREGLLEAAAHARFEVVAAHRVDHARVGCAIALRRSDEGEGARDRRWLRAVNEYRTQLLLIRVVENRCDQRIGELEQALRRLERDKADLGRRGEKLADELAGRRSQITALTAELERHRSTRDEYEKSLRLLEAERERADLAERQLHDLYRRLRATRTSLSFRLGRATRVAARRGRSNPLQMPRQWLNVFRGEDEILDRLQPHVPGRKADGEANEALASDERAAIERMHFLSGRDRPSGPGPGVAGITSPRLAVELDAATRFQRLTPNAWRYQLEVERPAFVLVTSDGLQPRQPWSEFGIPGGRGGADELIALSRWCRAHRLPICYWDTSADGRPRLGVPRGAHFDALFSVSAAACSRESRAGARPSLLPPAVEPLIYNPIGLAATPPRNVLFAGAFDRRLGNVELARLRALLVAGLDYGLEILDAHWGEQGPLASAFRLPDQLAARSRRLPSVPEEVRAVRDAGILVCHNAGPDRDFPSWQLLRGLASGAHVISTPAHVDEPDLERVVRYACDTDDAAEQLAELLETPRLGAEWRRALARLLESYSLRDRLNTIARTCAAPAVAPGPPRVGVLAVEDSAARASFDAFVDKQTLAPVAAKMVTSERLRRVMPAMDASHLVLWNPAMTSPEDAIAELATLARLSEAPVLALVEGTRPTGASSPVYRHGPIDGPAIVALRHDVALERLDAAALLDPIATAIEATREGASAFVGHRLPAAGSRGRRSVA